MPPRLALLLTLAFIGFLFWRDFREKPNITGALWLPLLWFLIIGSRFVSQWLDLFGLSVGNSSLEEGSPVDALVFFGLIACGIVVLVKRQANVSEIVKNNFWLISFLFYCFVAIVWSDFPFVALKRWVKVIGHPIMVLILFTEPDFEQAVVRLLKRSAFVLVPISILFIKYFPEWGRGFSQWTGQAYNTGITKDKNALGYICVTLGFFFFWHFLNIWKAGSSRARNHELFITSGFLVMIWWLLWIANAKTALLCFLIGALIVLLLGLRFVNKRFIGAYIVAGAIVFFIANLTFGISGDVIKLLGRDPTLTDRTEVWQDVLDVPINPILGAGFETFWLGERREKLAEKWSWQPNQAHNGYLETYLNLGIIGLAILLALIFATYRKACRELMEDFEIGRFRLGLFFAIVLYNWTDATFKALHPMWFAFYLIAIDYPTFRNSSSDEVVRDLEDENGPGEIALCPG